MSTTVAWNLGASLDQRKGIGEGVGVRETQGKPCEDTLGLGLVVSLVGVEM